jgi:hypothetical protein
MAVAASSLFHECDLDSRRCFTLASRPVGKLPFFDPHAPTSASDDGGSPSLLDE